MDKPLIAIDAELANFTIDAVANVRIPDEMVALIKKYQEDGKHEVIGFEFDGTYNFGVVLQKKVTRSVQVELPVAASAV